MAYKSKKYGLLFDYENVNKSCTILVEFTPFPLSFFKFDLLEHENLKQIYGINQCVRYISFMIISTKVSIYISNKKS